MLNSIFVRLAAETEEPASGISALGLDGKAFIIQLVTFLLVFYILKKYVFGRVVALLDKRREVIEQGVQLTADMVVQRDKLEKEVEKTMAKARTEADEILSKTQDQATQIIKEAEGSAQKKIDAMMVDAQNRIKDETAKAQRKIEQEVVNLVVDATEAIIGEKVDATKDKSIISKVIRSEAR